MSRAGVQRIKQSTERKASFAGGNKRSSLPSSVGARVTLRGIGIGVLLCMVIGVGAPYADHLLGGSYMDIDYSTPAAVFFLFVLVALVNPLLRWVNVRR